MQNTAPLISLTLNMISKSSNIEQKYDLLIIPQIVKYERNNKCVIFILQGWKTSTFLR